MKTAIVTGANGFVGAALCKKMLEKGVSVIAIVKNDSSDISGLSGLNGNITIYPENNRLLSLSDLISANSVDVFYHFAWSGTSGPKRADYETQIGNIKITCNAVELCHKLSCPRFVYASSIMEYEVQDLFSCNAPLSANTIYSSAKLAGNYMARALANDKGITYISGVISNIYGPGEYSPRLINTTIRKLLNKEHCSFSSGLQEYDFLYIEDAVKAFFMLGEEGQNNKNYYIGNQKLRPLKEFLIELRDTIDPGAELGFGELPSPVYSLSLDPVFVSSLYDDIGFEPEYTFKQGITKTAEWIKESVNG